MTPDMQAVEETLSEHSSHLKSIINGIADGALEGLKEGVASGAKRGARDGLKECISQGPGDIGEEDILDLLGGTSGKLISSGIKEGVRVALNKYTADYVQGVYRKLVERIGKGDIKISGDQADAIIPLLKKAKQQAMKNVMSRLPDNYFLKGILTGIEKSLDESLEKSLKAGEKNLRRELEKRNRRGNT